jgi:hypothetical protein
VQGGSLAGVGNDSDEILTVENKQSTTHSHTHTLTHLRTLGNGVGGREKRMCETALGFTWHNARFR